MFLLGSPGPCRRHLALAFCEMTGREVEYVSLSRDTTETDLKQRREIINSSVHYMDQVCRNVCVCARAHFYAYACYAHVQIVDLCISSA